MLTPRVSPPWTGEPLGLPINVRLHRQHEPTLLKLAQEMIEEVAVGFPAREFALVADAFFASVAGAGLPRVQLYSRMRRARRYQWSAQRIPPECLPQTCTSCITRHLAHTTPAS